MIWVKTDAGRAEIQARALVRERPQRNLLLLIDGKTSDDKLLAGIAGISVVDFTTLESLGLIVAANEMRAAAPSAPAAAAPAADATPGVDIDIGGLDFAQFRGALGRLISSELGMRGITMSMILEEAQTVSDLRDVAQRVLKQIGDRKGPAAVAEARRKLFGG